MAPGVVRSVHRCTYSQGVPEARDICRRFAATGARMNQMAMRFEAPVVRSPIALRPYQHDCLAAIAGAVQSGMRRLLVSMATGMGKTVIFSALLDTLGLRRMLV